MRIVVYGLVFLLAGAAALGIELSHRHTNQAARERFVARCGISAGFVATFSTQLLLHERHAGNRALTADPNPGFQQVVTAFGFEAAVLLDADGRLLAVAPAGSSRLGEPTGLRYPHLRSAVDGQAAASSVVRSAGMGEPVVAFATPFDTPSGRRVLSGAYLVNDTPLRDYLNALSTLDGLRSFIVDERGTIVASSGGSRRVVDTLAKQDPDIDRVLGGRSSGLDTRGQFVTSTPIADTPWRLVTSVPESSLPGATQGQPVLRWCALALLAGIALLACALWLRMLDQRLELRLANDRLDELAHRDGLTGVASRLRMDELMHSQYARCQRERLPLSLLLIDIDLFKRVNDTFGHASGDQVLQAVAERISVAVREEDTVGRWGGEEFLVLLPLTSPEEAAVVAERVRTAVCGTPITGCCGDALTISVSIGCSGDATNPPSVLLHDADLALYAAKAAGRNRVREGRH